MLPGESTRGVPTHFSFDDLAFLTRAIHSRVITGREKASVAERQLCAPAKGSSKMTAIIYPLHFRRTFEQRWAARMGDHSRRSPPEGTDRCVCGHTVVAPASSTYTPDGVVNHWQCSACGRSWTTSAPKP